MPYAGKIYVCPCLTMTIPDKLHLIGTLGITKQRDPSTRQYYYDRLFYHPVIGRLRLGIAHDCRISSHPLANVFVQVRCDWDEYDGTLTIVTGYLFRVKKPFETHETQVMPSSHMSLKTPFMCPHKNGKRWLRRFLDEAGMTSFVLQKKCRVYASDQCKCSVTDKMFDPYHCLGRWVKRVL